jgi:Skp family chaperone for outer membrane proteins
MTATLPIAMSPEAALATVEMSVTTAIHPIVESAAAITVTDSASYHVADSFRGRITDGLALVDANMDPIIKPQYTALQAAYALRTRLKQPLEQALQLIDNQMVAWQRRERARIDDERQKREEEVRREQARLYAQEQQERREHAERERAHAAAALPPPPAYVPPAPVIVGSAVAMPITPLPVASHSSARKSYTWTFEIAEVLIGILDGTVPLEVIQMNDKYVNAKVKNAAGRAEVAAWPGITVVEDVTIARKGST